MRKWWIQIILLPNLRSALEYLRLRDADDIGLDDATAQAGEAFIASLEKWLASGE